MKSTRLFLAVFVLVIASFTLALAKEAAPPASTQATYTAVPSPVSVPVSPDAISLESAINKNAQAINSLRSSVHRKITDDRKTREAIENGTDAIKDQTAILGAQYWRVESGLGSVVKQFGEMIGVIKKNNADTQAGMNAIRQDINSLGSQNNSNTLLLGILCSIGFIALVLMLLFLGRHSRRCDTNNHNVIVEQLKPITDASAANLESSNAILDELREGFDEMRSGFRDLPERTATAVRTLDASPIEFDADGHHVVYRSPAEGVREGFYLELHVPKGAAGDPDTYDRIPNASRGVTRRNAERIMNRYFRKELNTPEFALQKALIEHLRSTGELTWTTR